MMYAGKRIPAPKYKIGDWVRIIGLSYATGKIGHMGYREEESQWVYKVNQPGGGYQSWSEKSLRKVKKPSWRVMYLVPSESGGRKKQVCTAKKWAEWDDAQKHANVILSKEYGSRAYVVPDIVETRKLVIRKNERR